MKLPEHRQQHGFTLLELLVALSIFAVMSVMIFGGLTEVLQVRSATDRYTDRLTELQLAFMYISRDTRQLINRGVRGQFGDELPALLSNQLGKYKLELTRAGYPNPARINRSSLQRVAYGIEDNKLYRYRWFVLDRAADSMPMKTVLLNDINAFNLRFLNANGNTTLGLSNNQANNWVSVWPNLKTGETNNKLPKLIEVTLELEDWGRFTRVFEFPETI